MTTSTKTKQTQNQFDEEITSVYQVEVAPPRRSMFELDIDIVTEDEQHMLEAFHTQAAAVTGRAAIAQFATSHIGDMAAHTSQVMGQTTEQIYRIETAANIGRFEKPLQQLHNRLLDDTCRYALEVNRMAVTRMHDDTKNTIYPDKKPPARPKRKGMLRGFTEFFFGEE